MPDQWYLLRNNQPVGPYPTETLRQWLQTGQIPRDEQVVPVGGQQWQAIAAFPEFAGAAPAVLQVDLEPEKWGASPAAPGPAPVASAGAEVSFGGVARWLSRAWEMVSTDAGAFILATLYYVLITTVSIGICGPPLLIGMNRMLLRKHDKGVVQAGDIFEGFRSFGSSWGLALLVSIPFLVVMAPMLIVAIMVAASGDDASPALAGLQMLFQGIYTVAAYFIQTAIVFSYPLLAEDRAAPVAAIKTSWQAVRPHFWIYLVASLLFGVIGGAGVAVCCVGILFSFPLFLACQVAMYRERFPRR